MGAQCSTTNNNFKVITDKYMSYPELINGLRQAGLEDIGAFMYAVDMSVSNKWTGEKTYGRSLHDFSQGPTPYERCISMLFPILADFTSSNNIACYRFGCDQTRDRSIAPLNLAAPDGDPRIADYQSFVSIYRNTVNSVKMSGPTTMASIINAAAKYARESKNYTVLVIATDGDISDPKADAKAIIDASKTSPLSIICIGIGDGDESGVGTFPILENFDDKLKERAFDNFQMVSLTKLEKQFTRSERPELDFATNLFMEIPEQYKMIKKLGYLN